MPSFFSDQSNFPDISIQVIVDTLVFLTLCGSLAALNQLGQPGLTGFWCHDESISLPYKDDSISKPVLLAMGFGVPLCVILLTECFRLATSNKKTRTIKAQLLTVVKAYGVFMFGMAADMLLTEMLKYSVGRPRPHFMDVCKPHFDHTNCSSVIWPKVRYVEEYECSNTKFHPKLLRDSRLSFPSGHASVSVYSALFTVFYLQLRLELKSSYLLRPLTQFGVMLLAIYCCVSRITDHKHFASDIAAGSTIGFTFAWMAFYKLGMRVIPEAPTANKPRVLPRAMSVESEPQTPTPLLRPAAYVQGRRPDFADKV
ncbi:hypothetical protein EGW08_007647 [Elysia chlorotica]|uniref:Phosphatidic acid phosphatase type 2/haloperoxidase domain-containing protein n=1 Tax=Elysia chlorotica TaxID=188477 RepID=A0A3S1BIJ5_ELYCH|nr:hypothetical protein EGW08_007647 [Elysia chlorotica]